ncbi:extracellular solute-binding protein [Leptolyngbya sp. 15MV]|nr:extracellular solute-binding protein [Leptolyngbya sp. 15MV]
MRLRGAGWLAFLVAGLCLFQRPAAAQPSIAISCSALGIEARLCREGAEAWSQRSGVAVRLVSTPNSGTERLALYQQLLAARSADIDVFQVDAVWPGILANHLIDLRGRIDTAGHFEEIVRNNTVDGRLVAIPWFANAGLLYYRRDLVAAHGGVPETWQALTDTARAAMQAERARGNDRMWGYVFQGRAYEGLTVNGIEWLASHDAGRIVERDGRVSVNNPRAMQALSLARSWIGSITPLGVLNYAEEEARGVFQSGNAVFMRNWPYAWPLLNAEDSPVRGHRPHQLRRQQRGGVGADGEEADQAEIDHAGQAPDDIQAERHQGVEAREDQHRDEIRLHQPRRPSRPAGRMVSTRRMARKAVTVR